MNDRFARASAMTIERTDDDRFVPRLEKLDRDVNFFILMLEQLGAKTHFSCGGHPQGFYIVFSASDDLALQISGRGHFEFEMFAQRKWRLSMPKNDRLIRTDKGKRRTLNLAANAWEQEFGKLQFKQAPVSAADPQFVPVPREQKP